MVKLLALVIPGSQHLKERKVKLSDSQISKQHQGLFEADGQIAWPYLGSKKSTVDFLVWIVSKLDGNREVVGPDQQVIYIYMSTQCLTESKVKLVDVQIKG